MADAQALAGLGRFPRAAALAVLAEEELAKAFILRICMEHRRWDSAIYEALLSHGAKQALNDMLKGLAGNVFRRLQTFLEDDSRRVIPRPWSVADAMPSAEELEAAKQYGDRQRKDRPRDKVKQRAFYIGLGKDGAVTSLPADVDQAEFNACMAAAKSVDELVGVLWREGRWLPPD